MIVNVKHIAYIAVIIDINFSSLLASFLGYMLFILI